MMAIGKRVQSLRSALTTPDGYLSVIEDTIEEDNKLILTDYDTFTILLKSKYLLMLYKTVELEMPTITFTECCEQATLKFQREGWKIWSKHTVTIWHK